MNYSTDVNDACFISSGGSYGCCGAGGLEARRRCCCDEDGWATPQCWHDVAGLDQTQWCQLHMHVRCSLLVDGDFHLQEPGHERSQPRGAFLHMWVRQLLVSSVERHIQLPSTSIDNVQALQCTSFLLWDQLTFFADSTLQPSRLQ